LLFSERYFEPQTLESQSKAQKIQNIA